MLIMYLVLTSVPSEGMSGLDLLSSPQDITVQVKVSMCKPEIIRRGEEKE
jgi:hypothetical protein